MVPRYWLPFCFMVVLCGLAVASEAQAQGQATGPQKMTVTSKAFSEGAMIPAVHTCKGKDASPPLAWTQVPEGTKSIALIADDPDAPIGTFVHWVLFNLPSETSALPESVPTTKTLPNGAKQGVTTNKRVGYLGPCPPSGTHRYYFKVYALDAMLELNPGATKEQLLRAMEGHVLADGQLMGRFKK